MSKVDNNLESLVKKYRKGINYFIPIIFGLLGTNVNHWLYPCGLLLMLIFNISYELHFEGKIISKKKLALNLFFLILFVVLTLAFPEENIPTNNKNFSL